MFDDDAEKEEKRFIKLNERIEKGECTLFLGPGLLERGPLARGAIAAEWAKKYKYPLDEEPTLPQVAQYLAVTEEPQFPKQLIKEKFEAAQRPDFNGEEDPYDFFANQPFRYYIDCYYDNFLIEALRRHQFRGPGVRRDYARWDPRLQNDEDGFGADFEPKKNEAQTAVFHIFGYAEKPETLIVTQHDYLAFLENVSKDNRSQVIPPIIEYALSKTYLLFMGFNFFDLDFLVLLQALDQRIKKNFNSGACPHVSVQFVDSSKDEQARVEKYLQGYFGTLDISVCWGTCDEFIRKIKSLQDRSKKHE